MWYLYIYISAVTTLFNKMTLIEIVLIVSCLNCGFGGVIPHESLKNQNDEPNLWELSGKFEGDIVLTEGQRNGLVDKQYRWPDAIVPYEINQTSYTNKSITIIENAIATVANATCIKPRHRLPDDVNYIYITHNEPGCFSNVGKTGGKQILNLATTCVVHGIVIHEFVHALGFYHQQSDSTRDDFVTIHLENVIPEYVGSFNKYTSDLVTSFGEPYDYNSVMHYSRKAFSANGNDTIVPLDPNAVIGQRDGLSASDTIKIQKMYNCTL
ncbi:hypothetical protein FQR65_LT08091 [Abscondita terminalis]|nr:hypothetical protein FQR65_LT08091 [Abscondita terminalis]